MLRRKGRKRDPEDSFLLTVMVPIGKKDLLERTLEAASDADLGHPLWSSFLVAREDFKTEAYAIEHGRCIGQVLHRAVMGEV